MKKLIAIWIIALFVFSSVASSLVYAQTYPGTFGELDRLNIVSSGGSFGYDPEVLTTDLVEQDSVPVFVFLKATSFPTFFGGGDYRQGYFGTPSIVNIVPNFERNPNVLSIDYIPPKEIRLRRSPYLPELDRGGFNDFTQFRREGEFLVDQAVRLSRNVGEAVGSVLENRRAEYEYDTLNDLDDAGTLVVRLKRIPREADVPDVINFTVDATIYFDFDESLRGIKESKRLEEKSGDYAKYINPNMANWPISNRIGYYTSYSGYGRTDRFADLSAFSEQDSFLDGMGYIVAEDIKSGRASFRIYDASGRDASGQFGLNVGQVSRDISLGIYGTTSRNAVKVRLDGIIDTSKKTATVKVIHGGIIDQGILRIGDSLYPGSKWKVVDIEITRTEAEGENPNKIINILTLKNSETGEEKKVYRVVGSKIDLGDVKNWCNRQDFDEKENLEKEAEECEGEDCRKVGIKLACRAISNYRKVINENYELRDQAILGIVKSYLLIANNGKKKAYSSAYQYANGIDDDTLREDTLLEIRKSAGIRSPELVINENGKDVIVSLLEAYGGKDSSVEAELNGKEITLSIGSEIDNTGWFVSEINSNGVELRKDVVSEVEKEFFGKVENDVSVPSKEADDSFVLPVKSDRKKIFTSVWGEPRFGGRKHLGVDIDGDIGDSVFARGDGIIEEASSDSQCGNYIVIKYEDYGFKDKYCHLNMEEIFSDYLSKSIPKLDSSSKEIITIKKGDKVGEVGNTGKVYSFGRGDGSHLHWQVEVFDEELFRNKFGNEIKIQDLNKNGKLTANPAQFKVIFNGKSELVGHIYGKTRDISYGELGVPDPSEMKLQKAGGESGEEKKEEEKTIEIKQEVMFIEKEGKVDDYKLKIKKSRSKNIAYVTISPATPQLTGRSSFYVHIPIEKRLFNLTTENIDKKISQIDNTVKKLSGIIDKMEGFVQGWKKTCVVTYAGIVAKNFLFGSKAGARDVVMNGYDDEGGWNNYCDKNIGFGEGQYRTVDDCISDNAKVINKQIEIYNQKVNEYNKKVKENDGDYVKAYDKINLVDKNNPLVSSEDIKKHLYLSSMKEAVKGRDDIYSKQINLEYEEINNRLSNAVRAYSEAKKYYDENSGKEEFEKNKDYIINTVAINEFNKKQAELSGTSGEPLSLEHKDELIKLIEEKLLKGDTPPNKVSQVNSVVIKDKGETIFTFSEGKIISLKPVKYNWDIIKGNYPNFAGNYNKKLKRWFKDVKDVDIKQYEIDERSGIDQLLNSNQQVIILGRALYEDKNDRNKYYLALSQEVNNREYTFANNAEALYGPNGEPYCIPWVNDGEYLRVLEFYRGKDVKTLRLESVGPDGLLCTDDDIILEDESAIDIPENRIKKSNYISHVDRFSYCKGETISVGGKVFRCKKENLEKFRQQEQPRCTDVFSPGDCKLLYNVCDPVVCPVSRFNLGGRWYVNDVVQTGLSGSLVLGLPNWKNGQITPPICFTGVLASLKNFRSVLQGASSCLKVAKEKGESVGLCDKIRSAFVCELFWKEGITIIKVLGGFFSGKPQQGGVEYINLKSTLDNVGDSFDFFVNSYSRTVHSVYQKRDFAEIGAEICKSSIHGKVPSLGSFMDYLSRPSDPPQFTAFLSEVPSDGYLGASTYNVYYHIYAGSNPTPNGQPFVDYSVYLRNDVGGIYFVTDGRCKGVQRGRINSGGFVSHNVDCRAPEGFNEVCVEINGVPQCGFGKVSSEFVFNYLTDLSVSREIQRKINNKEECIGDRESTGSYVKGKYVPGYGSASLNVVRVCGASAPGDPKNWAKVGTCGKDEKDRDLGYCWLDTRSLDRIKNLERNEKLQNVLEERDKEYVVRKEGEEERDISVEIVRNEDAEKQVREIKDRYKAMLAMGTLMYFSKEDYVKSSFEFIKEYDDLVELEIIPDYIKGQILFEKGDVYYDLAKLMFDLIKRELPTPKKVVVEQKEKKEDVVGDTDKGAKEESIEEISTKPLNIYLEYFESKGLYRYYYFYINGKRMINSGSPYVGYPYLVLLPSSSAIDESKGWSKVYKHSTGWCLIPASLNHYPIFKSKSKSSMCNIASDESIRRMKNTFLSDIKKITGIDYSEYDVKNIFDEGLLDGYIDKVYSTVNRKGETSEPIEFRINTYD